MKIAQPRGMKIWLVFTIMSSLQPLPSCAGQIDVETQTDPMPLGPPPEQYQEWSKLEELFNNAVIDDVWTADEFEQAVIDGNVFRRTRTRIKGKGILYLLERFTQTLIDCTPSNNNYNCIDENGILHLIEVEEIDLAHVAELLHNFDKPITGFKFKNITNKYDLGCNSNPSITFDLCWFKSFGESNDNSNQSFKTIFRRCCFSYTTANRFFFNTALIFIDCNLDHAFFDECHFSEKIEFIYCHLFNSSFFNNSQFYKIKFLGCDLFRSSFDNARFYKDTNFKDCSLSNSSFFNNSQFFKIKFLGCDLFRSSFDNAWFHEDTNFKDCNLSDSSFDNAWFHEDTNFKDCSLSNSSFDNAWFYEDTNFKDCNLSNTSLDRSKFRHSLGLIGCLFNKTIFKHARIRNIYVTQNIPYDEDFTGAHIVSVAVLENCTVKLTGLRYLDPDADPFPGAFLIPGQVKLENCQDPLGNIIPNCEVRRAPYFKNLAYSRNNQSVDYKYYFDGEV